MREAQFRRLQKYLARNVRQRREALGLTQEDAAHACAMSVRHYQKMEAGELNITLRTLANVSRGLRCDLADLFTNSKS